MQKTKIEWTDNVWNPVWGCLHTCEFCYARKIAKRFGINIYNKEKKFKESSCHPGFVDMPDASDYTDFKPVFIHSNFTKDLPKEPSRIFVNSMSDIAFWKPEWKSDVLSKIKRHPQHTFLFLSKDPRAYVGNIYPSNCWLGLSITNEADMAKADHVDFKYFPNKLFLSIEPMLEKIDTLLPIAGHIKWVIIGAQTNPYKAPAREWIDKIVLFCRQYQIPVFMKNSLSKVYLNMIQEYPKK